MNFIRSIIEGITSVSSARYYVKPTGSDSNSGESWDAALKTIVKAMQTAKEGDEVWVAEGTYAESKTVINPVGVALYGGFAGTESQLSERNISAHPTIIDGGNARQCIQNFGVLDGFHITRGKSKNGGGIYNHGTVTNCTIYNNTATDEGGGIFNYDDGAVTNCTVYNNSAKDGGGIYNNFFGTVTNCISWKNSPEDILSIGSVKYSCFGEADGNNGNIRGNPLFVNTSGDSSTWDFRLKNGSPCVDTGSADDAPNTDIMGNPRPGVDGKVCMGAYESPDKYKPQQPRPALDPLYVSKSGNDANNGLSWGAALKTISAALNKIPDSDDLYQIWVAEGTYAEGKTLINPPRVALYGGFAGTESELSERNISAHPTIIDGEGALRCVKNSGVLDGFHITRGKSDYGGGIYNYGTVTDCTVFNNSAKYGGGIYNYGTVTSCTVYGNSAGSGGGIYNYFGTVTNCTVYGNSTKYGGGGIYNYYGTVTN